MCVLDESLIENVNTDNKTVFQTPIDPGSSYSIKDNTTAHTFGVIAVHDPDNSVTNTHGMNSGDRVIIIVNLTAIIPDEGGLPSRQAVSGTLTPEIGIKSQYDVTAPAVFSKRIVKLD
jgi:archaellin